MIDMTGAKANVEQSAGYTPYVKDASRETSMEDAAPEQAPENPFNRRCETKTHSPFDGKSV